MKFTAWWFVSAALALLTCVNLYRSGSPTMLLAIPMLLMLVVVHLWHREVTVPMAVVILLACVIASSTLIPPLVFAAP